MDEEPDENIKRIVEVALAHAAPQPSKKLFFSPEINLGHLIVALTFLAGGFASYISFHDGVAERTARIKSLEVSQDRTDKTIDKIVDNQAAQSKNVDKLTWIVEQIQKDKK